MKKQESIVKEYLISKGFVDYWVKNYKQEPSIYLKSNWFEFKKRLLMESVIKCSSNLVDLTTSLSIHIDEKSMVL
jgi:hypothetical protein